MRTSALALTLTIALASTFLGTGCGADECGTYHFSLPETAAAFAGSPELVPPSQASELCGNDFGSQGNWDVLPGESVLLFQPDDGEVGTFSDLFLSITFATAEAADGKTLQVGNTLTGVAFTGLMSTHHDTAPLASGSLTFHTIGPLLIEDVFNRRLVDLSWDLRWSAPSGADEIVYEASGRDEIDMYVDK